MKLLDVVQLVDAVQDGIPSQIEFRRKIEADLKAANRLDDRYDYPRDWLSITVKPVIEKWNKRRTDLLNEHGWVQDELLGTIQGSDKGYIISDCLDDLARKSLMPRVELAAARQVAEKAEMLIFPFDYLHASAEPDDPVTRNAIDGIRAVLDDCSHYVIAPLSCLDLRKLAHDSEPGSIFVPERLVSPFQMIEIQLPMFRMVLNNRDAIRELDSRVTNAEGLANGALRAVNDLSQRVDRLQEEVDRRLREQAVELAKQRENVADLAERLAAQEAAAFRMQDPLHLAIPKSCDGPRNDGRAYVGPCWGPDIDEIFMAARNLQDTGARKAIEESLERWSQR